MTHLLDREPGLRRALTDATSPSGGQERPGHGSCWTAESRRPTRDLVTSMADSRWSSPRDLADAAEQLAVLATAAAAERDGQLDDLEDELFRFGRIVSAEPDLRSALADPALPPRASAACWTALLAAR